MPTIQFLSKEVQFVKKIHAGDRRAERDLYEYCKDYCINSMTGDGFYSEDYYQDAFIQVWDEIQDGRIFLCDGAIWRLPKAKNAVAAPMTCSLRTFIVDICKYKRTKEKSGVDVSLPFWPSITDDSFEDFNKEEFEEQLKVINLCIEEMSPHCREILTLFYVKCLKLEQIMEMRGKNESKDGLKSSKSKCLKRLRDTVLSTYESLR